MPFIRKENIAEEVLLQIDPEFFDKTKTLAQLNKAWRELGKMYGAGKIPNNSMNTLTKYLEAFSRSLEREETKNLSSKMKDLENNLKKLIGTQAIPRQR